MEFIFTVRCTHHLYSQCVKQCVRVPHLVQNKTVNSKEGGWDGGDDSIECTVVTLSRKKYPPNSFTALILLLYFSPDNKDPLKTPTVNTQRQRGKNGAFSKMHFFSLCPCVPIVNAVCPVRQETSPQKGIASAGAIGTTSPLCATLTRPTRC